MSVCKHLWFYQTDPKLIFLSLKTAEKWYHKERVQPICAIRLNLWRRVTNRSAQTAQISCSSSLCCLLPWLLNVKATWKESVRDLSAMMQQFHVLPHWDISCRSNDSLLTVWTIWQDMSRPLYSGCEQDTVACEHIWGELASWTLHSVIAKKWNRQSTTFSRTVPSGGNRDTS